MMQKKPYFTAKIVFYCIMQTIQTRQIVYQRKKSCKLNDENTNSIIYHRRKKKLRIFDSILMTWLHLILWSSVDYLTQSINLNHMYIYLIGVTCKAWPRSAEELEENVISIRRRNKQRIPKRQQWEQQH